MKTDNILLTALTALALSVLVGCSSETELQNAPDMIPEGVARIEFAIKGVKTGTSYASTPTVALEANERTINDVTAYLFKLADGESLNENSVVTDVLPTTLGANTGKGSFDLGKSDVETHYAIVFIANKACFDTALADVTKTSNTTYAELNAIETLENTVIMEGLKSSKGLPMYALANVSVPVGSGKISIDAKFIRPISRFDIDNRAVHSFTVESVMLVWGRKNSVLNVPGTPYVASPGTIENINYTSFLSNVNEKLATPNADGSKTQLRPAFYVSPGKGAVDGTSLEVSGQLRIGLNYYPRTYRVPLTDKDTQNNFWLSFNKRYRLTLLMDKDDNVVGEVAIDLGEWEDNGNDTPDVEPDLDLQVNPTGITAGVTYDLLTHTFNAPVGVTSFRFEMLNDVSQSVATDGTVVKTVKVIDTPNSRGVNATTYEVTFGNAGTGYFIFATGGGTSYRFEMEVEQDPTKYPGTILDLIEVGNLLWSPVNVGATSVDEPGKLFQWGRMNGWVDGATVVAAWVQSTCYIADSEKPENAGNFISPISICAPWWPNDETTENINALMARWAAVSDGTNNPCPKGWRLPTKSEVTDLLASQTPTVEVVSAEVSKLTVRGVPFISKEHVYGAAGARLYTTESLYWIATDNIENPDVIKCSKDGTITLSTPSESQSHTSHACSIRCVKDKPATP